MGHSAHVRRLAPDEWRTYRDLRLRALAESPDAFGSTLEQERERPAPEWERRLDAAARSSSEAPLVAQRGDEAVGLAWARLQEGERGVAHLYQVWVAPEHRGHGVARALLDAATAWARAAGAHTLALDVTCGDTPAMRLYTRAGFQPAGDTEPLRPGSSLNVQPLRLALGDAAAPTKPHGGTFVARLLRYPGPSGWHFAPVPDEFAPPVTHAWGRSPVRATVDGQTWNTSVWRDTKSRRALLAVPKRIRGTKGDGDPVTVRLEFTL